MNQGNTSKSTQALQLSRLLAGQNPIDVPYTLSDWNALIDLAKENGVSQMLYTVLLAQGFTAPVEIVERLRSIHLAGVVDGAKRHHQFDQILDALTNAGIVVIPVKGVWLSESVYANIAMRGMSDMDLWIQKGDVDRALGILQTLGYQPGLSDINRPQELQDALLGETLLMKNGAPFVEVHWRIFAGQWLRHAASIEERLIWERSLPWRGEMVRQLQPEDAFIHVAIHLAINHQMSMSALRTMLDLHMLRMKLKIDWNLVVDRAKTWRVATPMWLVVDSMMRLFGDDVELSAALTKVRPSLFRRWCLQRFFSPEGGITGDKITGLRKFVFLILLVDHPRSALQLAKHSLWPDRTWLTLRYGLTDAPAWRIALQRIVNLLRFVIRRAF
jgi:hypothetical protein